MVLLKNDAFDQELLSHVAPADWENPKPQALYDMVVVGGGTAGLITAAIAAGLGAKVAMVERELLGGDCLNYGCVPSKGLLSVSKRLGILRRGHEYGIAPTEGGADFGAVMERMRRLRAGISHHDGAARFTELGVDVFLGTGRFTANNVVEVKPLGNTEQGSSHANATGETVTLKFKRAVIATGARPLVFPVPGLEDVPYLTNLSLFSLTELPESLAIVGAGPIGVEMAQAFARFGCKVTIIAMDKHILPREDPEAAAFVQAALAKDGVVFELGAKMSRAEMRDGKKVVVFERDGKESEVVASELLLAMGRAANVDGLGLEDAGVEFDRRGIKVNDNLRSTNKRIFAAGDVAGSYQFTHAADAMARLVIRNAFFFGRGKVSDLTMPWTTYTDPEVAHVGLYASEDEKAGCALSTLRMDFKDIDRNILEGETDGFAKVVFEKKSGKLRGATVVGAHAGELLGEMLIAVNKRMKVTELSSIIHPYPTSVSIWGRLGDQASGARLTPGIAKLLKRIISWRR
jgi:pyruvate/2-oxoglutarate dehydrogenase complex dihydrolipoamide dehydrogenase (E3) component